MTQLLRVGTDCSGIEAPIQALRLLGVPHRHCFSSEIDRYCIQSIKANYEPELLYGDPERPYPDGDITHRDHSILPDIDLYICGFPCQPFSIAGKKKGLEDLRGNVFWSCLDVIKVKQPKYFILENVKGLLSHEKGKTWNIIWNSLLELEEYGYLVKWQVLNTRNYGIPQNRERIYMVGIKNDNFNWPEPTDMDDIKLYVDYEDTQVMELPPSRKNTGPINNLPQNAVFIDLSFCNRGKTNISILDKYSTCITRSSSMWNIIMSRRANIRELLELQGFSKFKIVVSNTQVKYQVGNSMSVNVLCALLANIIDV